MKRSRVIAAAVAVVAAVLVVGAATAAGPSPGTITGFGGATSSDGKVRFVAVTSAHDTVLEKIDSRNGRVLRFGSIRGAFIAALLIGLVDTLGRFFAPVLLRALLDPSAASQTGRAVAPMLIYILMAAVLFFRPSGLFPAKK